MKKPSDTPLPPAFVAGMIKIIFLSLGLLHARQSTSVVCEDVKLTATVLRRGGIVYRISFKKTKGETGEKVDPSDGGKTAG